MKELWGNHPVSYDGRYVSFDRVFSTPGLVGTGVPIVLRGHRAAARRPRNELLRYRDQVADGR